jgi:hypothetical protein
MNKRSNAMEHIAVPSHLTPTMRMMARAGDHGRQSQNPPPQADPRIFCRRFAPLTPPRRRAASSALARNSKEIVMSAATAIALLVPLAHPLAQAHSLGSLQPGLYLPEKTSCDFIGGANTVDFDGKNLSGHYHMCVTQPSASSTYKSTCVEAQGQDFSTLTESKVLASPDRFQVTQKIVVTSSRSFDLNGVKYRFCGGR